MKRILLIVVAVLAVLAGAAWLMQGRIAEAGMRTVFEHAMAADPLAELPDGLNVGLCGTGSPMPDPTRAGPCVAIVAGKRLFVVDSGSGSTRNLALMDLQPAQVQAVFITHFHSDHIADLGELMLQRWAAGAAKSPIPVYGPTGVEGVVAGFQAAYALDRGFRIAHHGVEAVPPSGFGGTPHPFAVSLATPDVVLIDEPDLKVTAFPVNHHPADPAVGYRFEYKGRTVVVSGDTGPSERLVAAAKGVDVLAHEGLAPNLVAIQKSAALKAGRTHIVKILSDIPSYHTAPEAAAAEAQRAGVKTLLFYHVIPPLPVRALEGPFLGKSRSIYKGPIRVGHDGDFLSLPAGSTEIRHTNRMPPIR